MESMSTDVAVSEAGGNEPPFDPDIVVNGNVPANAAAARPVAPKPAKHKPKPTNAPTESIEREMELGDAMDVRDWLDTLVPEGEIKVHISRKTPKLGPNGENIGGALETVDERIDEDYIREHWGGGTFAIAVMTPRANGQFKIFRRMSMQLAGPPKMNGSLLQRGNGAVIAAAPEVDSLAERAFDAAQATATRAEERAERLRDQIASATNQRSGLDADSLSAITAPIMAQLQLAQETIRDLQGRALDNASRPPPRDEMRDEIFKMLITGDRSEADKVRQAYESRLGAQQERYEARIDRLTDDHAKDKTRLEERFRDELRSMEKRHERELDMIAKLGTGSNAATESAHKVHILALEETIKRLERDLGEKGTAIATLQGRKDQTPIEKAEEIMKMQEVFESLGGGGAAKDEKWYERLINAVGNSEAALGFINKMAGGAPADQPGNVNQVIHQPQQEAQLPPPNVPFRHTDGNVYIHDGAGNFTQVMQPPRKKKKRQQAANANAAAGDAPPAEGGGEPEEPSTPPGRPPDVKEFNLAIQFMENSLRGTGITPESFAATARNMMPTDVLAYVMAFDNVDDFMKTMKLSPGSPLATVRGRQFLRAVHQILRTGSSDG